MSFALPGWGLPENIASLLDRSAICFHHSWSAGVGMTSRDIRVLFEGSSSMRQPTAGENAADADPLVSVDGSSFLDRLKFKLGSDEELAAKLQAGNMAAFRTRTLVRLNGGRREALR